MALTDVLRKMALEALEKGECSGPAWQIIAMGNELSHDEVLALRVNDERRRDLVKGERRLTNSYITNTCNRMSALQHADKSVSIRFGESDSGDKTLTLKIKNGRMKMGSRGQATLAIEKKGYRDFAERIMRIAPDISHLEGDERKLGALEGIRLIKEFIRQEAGI